MTKTDLINAVAEKSNLEGEDAKKAVNAVLEAISESLVKGDAVQLLGFGTFAVKERPERQGFNPVTKEKITIPAKKVASFKAGTALKKAVE